MISIVERCCRTCADMALDPYRASLRCVASNRPVSAGSVCDGWWLNENVVGGKLRGRDIVLVSPIPEARTDLELHR